MKRIELGEGSVIGNKDGEVIKVLKEGEHVVILEDGDRVLNKARVEELRKLTPIKMRFAKVNLKAFGMICRKYPVFTNMIEYVGYQTGKLVYRNGVSINRKNLARACGVSMATIDRQMKGLIEDDVIKVVHDGRDSVFYVNPYIIHIGKCVYESLATMFSDTIYKRNYEKTLEGVRDE